MLEPAQPTILLIDDDVVNRKLMAWIFRNAGYSILEAATGAEALLLAEQRPDVAILDVNLPDMTGFDVCRRIKSNPVTLGISVVHLSAVFIASDDRTQGLEQGADAYLVKPIENRELLATVKALLRLRQVEAAARRAEQEWKTTFEAIADGVCLLGPNTVICRCNTALGEMLGQESSRLVGQSLDKVLHRVMQDDSFPFDWLLSPILGRRSEEIKLGSRYFRLTADQISGDEEGPSGSVVIFRDITRRMELQDRIRQGQRLEAIGRLAGGVAHEFNNLLTTILGNITILGTMVRDPDAVSLLASVERSSWRAAELTKQLLGFSRQALLWLRPVEPAALLSEIVSSFGARLPINVTLVGPEPRPLSTVHADPDQLKLIVRQLLAQAVEAMPQGGTVRVRAEDVVFDDKTIQDHPDASPGIFVRISVADGGEALTPEAVQRVFEPFFSRGDHPGGLGLAMAYGTARQHGGWLECHSEPGRGTRFDLYLPRHETKPTGIALPASPLLRGRYRILLADDTDALLELAAGYLRQAGYEVVTANDGRQAMEIYTRQRGEIDLVILDHVMPHLSGQEALRRMRRLEPNLRALIASGSGGGSFTSNDVQGVVLKPYQERELLNAVQAALVS